MRQRSSGRTKGGKPSKPQTPATPTSTSTTSSIDLGIAARLESDKRFRERYFHVWAANEVATELRKLRKLRTLRQADLAEVTGTKQSAISRIEKQSYDAWTFKTLLTIANALKARIDFKLTPLEDIVAAHSEQEESDALAGPEDIEFEEYVDGTGSRNAISAGVSSAHEVVLQ